MFYDKQLILVCIMLTNFPSFQVRSIISDFAVTIAIALMVLFDLLIDVNTSKLKVPQSFRVNIVV